jgi:hypothetical protein
MSVLVSAFIANVNNLYEKRLSTYINSCKLLLSAKLRFVYEMVAVELRLIVEALNEPFTSSVN